MRSSVWRLFFFWDRSVLRQDEFDWAVSVQPRRQLSIHQVKRDHVMNALKRQIVQSVTEYPIRERRDHQAILERDEEVDGIRLRRLRTDLLGRRRRSGNRGMLHDGGGRIRHWRRYRRERWSLGLWRRL